MGEVAFEPIELTALNSKTKEIIDVDVMHSIKDLKAFMSYYKKKYSNEQIRFIRVPMSADSSEELSVVKKEQVFKFNNLS